MTQENNWANSPQNPYNTSGQNGPESAPGYRYAPPQQNPTPNYLQYKPNNNLALAIIATILCFWPTGVVAIVYASKVDTLWFAGNHVEANETARKAKTWAFITIALLPIMFIALFFFFIFFGLLSSTGS